MCAVHIATGQDRRGRKGMDDGENSGGTSQDGGAGEAGAEKKKRGRRWEPDEATRKAMTAAWRPIGVDEVANAEPADAVIENNMRFHAILGNRLLHEAAARLQKGGNVYRNVEFLIQKGLEHRDRAEKSAVELLPYRKGKVATTKLDKTEAPKGIELDDVGRDQLAVELAKTFKAAKRRDKTSK